MSILFAIVAQIAFERFPGPDWVSEETTALVQPYWDCAQRAAGRLEPSDEAADLVAEAAMEECREERISLWASIVADALMARVENSTDVEGLFEKFDNELKRSLILGVVKIRSDGRN